MSRPLYHHRNPFNGIESWAPSPVLAIINHLSGNPFNGIESGGFIPIPGHTHHLGIHSMELKAQRTLETTRYTPAHRESIQWNWKVVGTAVPPRIHSMELKARRRVRQPGTRQLPRIHSMELKVKILSASWIASFLSIESIQWNWKNPKPRQARASKPGIHSMELKALAHMLVLRYAAQNPFNGIESGSPHPPAIAQDGGVNPFNGIERWS